MARLEDALPTLNELRRLGVRLSVDDFGTGCSSLAPPVAAAVDSLKIDRSLRPGPAARLERRPPIVRAIVLLGDVAGQDGHRRRHRDGRAVRAAPSARLRSGQGFHLARPLAAALIGKMLVGSMSSARTRRRRAPWRRGVAALTIAPARAGCQNFRSRSDLSSHRRRQALPAVGRREGDAMPSHRSIILRRLVLALVAVGAVTSALLIADGAGATSTPTSAATRSARVRRSNAPGSVPRTGRS